MIGAHRNPQAVQDYIAGRLTEPELTAFEDRLLVDATLVQDVEETLRLREGLEILRERNDLGVSVRPRRHIFLTRRFAAAAAAALLLIALCVSVYIGKRSPTLVAASVGELHAGATLLVTNHYSFASMRAASETPDLALPASGALEFRALTPGAGTAERFRAILEKTLNSRDVGRTVRIGQADHLAPDADGFIAIYADASKLEPGDYSLAVESDIDDKAPSERFSFKLHRSSELLPNTN
jgi:hypothetical protein